jgi:pyruvate/2-oxoglutarate dehydrogenase complex dihydrolipoamide acyltransferase (E2) component
MLSASGHGATTTVAATAAAAAGGATTAAAAASTTAAASAAAAAALYTSTLTQLEVTDGVQRSNTGGLHSRLHASPTVKSALTEGGVDYEGVRTQVAHGIEQVCLSIVLYITYLLFMVRNSTSV